MEKEQAKGPSSLIEIHDRPVSFRRHLAIPYPAAFAFGCSSAAAESHKSLSLPSMEASDEVVEQLRA